LKDADFDRSSRTDYGDIKTLPYVPDMINLAVKKINSWDVVLLTNDDTCLSPDIYSVIQETIPQYGAIWSARREHAHLNVLLSKERLMHGYKHVGADVFAFTKAWWMEHGHEMPDMFMALENWDYVLRLVILDHGGMEIEGLCYHEVHQGAWLMNRTLITARHNQKIGGEFFGARK